MHRIGWLLLAAGLAGCSRPAPEPRASDPATAAVPAPPAAPAPAPSDAPPAPAAAAIATDPDAPARLDGYGDLRFGMDPAQARKAWGGELKGAAAEPGGCYYLVPARAGDRPQLTFMIADGRFVRYDVPSGRETAPGGGRIGMTEQQLRQLYPGLEVQPHKYTDGHYLRIADAAAGTALLFETDAAGTVTRWRVGTPPQVDYVEGCS